MKHKHCDLIMAWANGEKVQYRAGKAPWRDIDVPAWSPENEYRIKPKELKFRNFISKYESGEVVSVVSWEDQQREPRETWRAFIKWLGDWQTVEVV